MPTARSHNVKRISNLQNADCVAGKRSGFRATGPGNDLCRLVPASPSSHRPQQQHGKRRPAPGQEQRARRSAAARRCVPVNRRSVHRAELVHRAVGQWRPCRLQTLVPEERTRARAPGTGEGAGVNREVTEGLPPAPSRHHGRPYRHACSRRERAATSATQLTHDWRQFLCFRSCTACL